MSIFSFRKPERQEVELFSFINQVATQSKRSRAYKRKFWSLAAKIHLFEMHRSITISSGSFSYQVFEDFLYFLKQQHPYHISTLEGIKASLTVILNKAERKGNYVNWEFSDWKFVKEERQAVYLTEKEIAKIHSLKLDARDTIIRDLFVIGCCTGLRFSDYTALTEKNLSGNLITTRTKKTGAKVVLPVHWMIREILDRNDGQFPLMHSSQQNFNKVVKTLCKQAGITAQVLIERYEGNRVVKRTVKKYELVASHTARRSFATNMYLAGVSPAKIMLLTGHITEEAFFKYIRISKTENARELGEHAFFKLG